MTSHRNKAINSLSHPFPSSHWWLLWLVMTLDDWWWLMSLIKTRMSHGSRSEVVIWGYMEIINWLHGIYIIIYSISFVYQFCFSLTGDETELLAIPGHPWHHLTQWDQLFVFASIAICCHSMIVASLMAFRACWLNPFLAGKIHI